MKETGLRIEVKAIFKFESRELSFLIPSFTISGVNVYGRIYMYIYYRIYHHRFLLLLSLWFTTTAGSLETSHSQLTGGTRHRKWEFDRWFVSNRSIFAHAMLSQRRDSNDPTIKVWRYINVTSPMAEMMGSMRALKVFFSRLCEIEIATRMKRHLMTIIAYIRKGWILGP